MRSYQGDKKAEDILVVLNMSGSSQSIQLDQPSDGKHLTQRLSLLTSFPTESTQKYDDAVVMDPYSVYIAKVVR
jgi:hypothetical protein